MSGTAATGRLLGEIVVISTWLGAVLLFSASVAPAAFATLPTRTLAGALVGRVLPVLFYAGVGVGLIVAVLAWMEPRAPWRAVLGAVAAVACAASQLWVGGRIAALRARLATPLESLPPGDPGRAEFGMLHGISVLLLGIAAVALLAALVLAILGVSGRQST